jgi:hypothetical protein
MRRTMLFPPKLSKELPTLLMVTIIAGFLLSFSPTIEGQNKKTRRVATKSGKRGKSARRSKLSRAQSDPLPLETYQAPPTYPDNIEVFEYGSSDSPVLGRMLNMPNKSLESTDLATPLKLVNMKIDASRVSEIQQALASRGFYRGEPTGSYDESTVDAMRRFQLKENISATGYPTAHALRRLGLAKW